MRIIDSTRQSMGWNNPFQTRRQNQITRIVWHHSATATGSRQAFEKHWRKLGWRNGGYSEIIHQNGDVEICYVPETVTNGAAGHNLNSYHICLVGNFRENGNQPTQAQLNSALERTRINQRRFNIRDNMVQGHNQLQATICPGIRMVDIRRRLPLETRFVNKALPMRKRASASAPVVTRLTVGQEVTLTGKRVRSNSSLGDWIQIRSGNHQGYLREVRLQTTRPQVPQAIRVGDGVRVRQGARWIPGGQQVPNFVVNRINRVRQINGANAVLEFDRVVVGTVALTDLTRA